MGSLSPSARRLRSSSAPRLPRTRYAYIPFLLCIFLLYFSQVPPAQFATTAPTLKKIPKPSDSKSAGKSTPAKKKPAAEVDISKLNAEQLREMLSQLMKKETAKKTAKKQEPALGRAPSALVARTCSGFFDVINEIARTCKMEGATLKLTVSGSRGVRGGSMFVHFKVILNDKSEMVFVLEFRSVLSGSNMLAAYELFAELQQHLDAKGRFPEAVAIAIFVVLNERFRTNPEPHCSRKVCMAEGKRLQSLVGNSGIDISALIGEIYDLLMQNNVYPHLLRLVPAPFSCACSRFPFEAQFPHLYKHILENGVTPRPSNEEDAAPAEAAPADASAAESNGEEEEDEEENATGPDDDGDDDDE